MNPLAPAPAPPSARARRARGAVAVLFLTNGAVFANLVPRYPAIVDQLGLANAQFGLAVAAFPLGALLAGLTAGMLIRRFRSSRVAVAGMALTSAGIFVAGTSPAWGLLAAGLFAAGAMDAITDVAQNSHGLRVQRLYRRSIINSFHAVWRIGAVLGGLMGTAAAALSIPLTLHLAVSGALFTLLAAACYPFLLPGSEPRGAEAAEAESAAGKIATPPAPLHRYGILAALVLIAMAGTLVEDAGSSWAALYLANSLSASASVAGIGFVALVGAPFAGRLVGDRLVDRFGQRAVAQAGGAVAAAGMGLALAFPTIPGTIVGFAAAGLGVATLVPAAMQSADALPGLPPGTGLTVVSWLMRLGFLLSPPVVGAVADAAGLRFGLLVIPLAGLVVLTASPVLAKRDGNRTHGAREAV